MNIRRILYIAAFCAIAAFFYYNQQSDLPPLPQAITRDSVLQAFETPTGQIPDDLIKDGYSPADIYFPGDYDGQAGDEFYVSLVQGENYLTLKYVIRAKDSDDTLEYFNKDKWENFKPPAGKFEQISTAGWGLEKGRLIIRGAAF